MAKKPKTHAPMYPTTPKEPPETVPMCDGNENEPTVAVAGDMVNCQACLRKLWDRSQWFIQLQAKGILFPEGRRAPRPPRKKGDPRQLDFADMIGRDD